ncbi:Uncharacterised protein [Bordetella pertussis]|nr:Uncharacterised protein [Bordetella pertussis]CFW44018.1 Uncharacterised protein [Bordetella pertussis]
MRLPDTSSPCAASKLAREASASALPSPRASTMPSVSGACLAWRASAGPAAPSARDV